MYTINHRKQKGSPLVRARHSVHGMRVKERAHAVQGGLYWTSEWDWNVNVSLREAATRAMNVAVLVETIT